MGAQTLGHTARFAVPAARPTMVARPRIVERLHASVGSGLSLLQAPGGYGKTAVAAEFARELEFEARWLSLDASAQAPEVFAEQLARAVLRHEAWAPPIADGDEALHAYLGAVIRQFEDDASLPLLLVIDNAHHLAESDASSRLLGWLLQSLPAGAETLLLTRDALAIDEIDRRVVGGECLQLGTADLAFDEDEVRRLAAHTGAADADTTAILEATGGWPIAVGGVLAGTLSIEGTARAVTRGAWERYLATEIWQSVPDAFREPLLVASLPHIAEAEIMEDLLGRFGWDSLLQWLDTKDFFSAEAGLDNRSLNPLLQRFLREQFRSDDPVRYREFTRTIADFYLGEDRLAEAIELGIDHADGVLLQELLEGNGASLFQRGAYSTLRRALDAIGPDDVHADAFLAALNARLLSHQGKPGDAAEISQDVLGRESAPIEALHHARLARARALRLLGRMNEVHAVLDVPMDDQPSDPLLQAEFAWHRAHTVLAIDSDLERAHELLSQSMAAAQDAGSRVLELLCRSTIGQVLVMKGDGPASVAELVAAAQGWREMRGSAHLAWVLNNLGMAHIMVGDIESALASLAEARDESRIAGNSRAEAFAIASLGDALLADGNAAEARTHYEQTMSACADEHLDESLAALATAGLAGALLEQGDVERADFVIRHAVEIAEGLGSPFELATCLQQQAAIASAAEVHAEAVKLASRAVDMFASIGADAALRQARYRLALIHFRDGEREAAETVLVDLSSTITAPWMAGGLRPLVKEHPMFAQWVESREVAAPSLRRVIREAAFAPEPATAPEEPSSAYPRVVARSLGSTRVVVDGVEVSDEDWESVRAKELFFLFLAHPEGIRKEEAFAYLYPDLPASRCNSQFHSNLYRVRKALYKESIIKRDGAYLLNPDGDFDWDVDRFREALDTASGLPAGSSERAAAYEEALQLYRGPFADAFFSEWAASLRDQLAQRSVEALAMLGGYYAGREDYESAAGCMEKVLETSPFNDEAAFLLATYRYRAGQPAAALAFLDDYRQGLRREMGTDLPGRLHRLRQSIAAGAAV
ncbi:MAG: BTAD domain-containing putative transcriptional regulator [Dehalococcoidia bacterium]|nr:BTAD domain-containing putative transcriptional regulator [Dehalococcoidia bacterium]